MRAPGVSMLVSVLLLGCSGDDEARVDAGDETTTTTTSADGSADETTTTGRERSGDDAEWCATWERMREEPEPTPDELRSAGAPPELDASIEVLATLLEVYAATDEDPRGEALLSAIRASTEIEAWIHEACGGDHPFCTAWTGASAMLAALAFSTEGDAPLTEEQTMEAVRVALAHAPAELAGPADEVRAVLGEDLDGPLEREAESAYDALDAWTEEHCELLD